MERELAFLKRHGFVIAGVALPLLVIAAVVLARALPRTWVDDPRYQLVYEYEAAYANSPTPLVCDVAVVEGRVRVRWARSEQLNYLSAPRVFRLDPAGGEPIELALPPPPGDLADVGDSREAFVEGLDDVRIKADATAPDDWIFETTYSGGGLFGEIFGGGSRGPRTSLHKDGRRIAVPHPEGEPYHYSPPTLLGWCLPIAEGGCL